MPDVALSVPLKFRRGALREDEQASVNSALELLALVNSVKPLAQARMLDFGCGVKLVQGLAEKGHPQALYVGLDVYRDMIKFLQGALSGNDHYAFGWVDFQNDMYNKVGEVMTPDSRLDVPEGSYDILTMFSVITHMQPRDVNAIFHILRRLAAPEARLIFSTFVDENQIEDFIDEDPERPLLRARYRKGYLERLLTEAHWKIEKYNRPIMGVIQHHYICSPA